MPDTLKLVYCSFFPSLTTYRIIFWVNSSHSIQVFRKQKGYLNYHLVKA